MNKKSKNKQKYKIATWLLVILLVIAILILGTVILHTMNAGKFAKGVMIAGVNLGGFSYTAGLGELQRKIDEFETRTIKFTATNKNFDASASLDELGIKINLEKALTEAFEIGKNKPFYEEFYEDYLALFGKYKHGLQYEVNYENLDFFFESTIEEVEIPVQNASLEAHADKTLTTIPSEIGYEVPRDKLYGEIYSRIVNLNESPINIPFEPEMPRITEDSLEEAKSLAEKLMLHNFSLTYKGKYWTIPNYEIYSYLSFIPKEEVIITENLTDVERTKQEIDRKMSDTFFAEGTKQEIVETIPVLKVSIGGKKLDELLYNIRMEITSDAKNARFSPIKDGNGNVLSIETIEYAQNGVTLDEEATKAEIELATSKDQESAEIVAKIIEPEFKDNNAIAYGITKLLGRSSLPLLNSPANRRHNISIGTSKINGIILKPGEQFSFNEGIGEVSIAEGFKSELVIKENKVIPELGGGLCHISSSLFQAVTSAGLEVTERHNHSFHVVYYGNIPGYDATIYPPSVDLKFINNTPSNILVKGFIESDALVFEIYGTNDRREILIDGPHAYDQQSNGAVKAWLLYKVTRDGAILQEKKFISSYKPPGMFSRE